MQNINVWKYPSSAACNRYMYNENLKIYFEIIFDIYLIWLFIKNIQNFIWLLIFTESSKTFNKLEKLKLIICLIGYNFIVK